MDVTKKLLLISIFLLLGSLVVFPALAGLGVGVNLGKIEIDQPLKPGGIYNLPAVTVINTGDEASDYEVGVSYHQDQSQLRPQQEWFDFNPSQFHLAPKASQIVQIRLSLPLKAQPADYFAYLEAHPVIHSDKGTTVGIAAAAKLYFTVIPANVFQALFYKIISFFSLNAPWSYVITSIILTAILFNVFLRFFSLNLKNIIKKK